MKLGVLALLVTVTWGAPTWAADAISTDDTRIKALGDADAMTRRVAIQELIGLGAAAVPPLTAVLDRNGPIESKAALQALAGIAGRQKAGDQQKELSERLVAELNGKHAVQTRIEICRLLGLIGGSECVDSLYKLLIDEDLREAARQALIRIPSREATQALVAGLQITDGQARVTLVDAIGERKDAAALPILRSLAIGPSERLSQSALKGLSRIPFPGAAQVLVQAMEAGKPGALAALLTLIDTLAEQGMTDVVTQSVSKALLRALDKADQPPDVRARIVTALGQSGDAAVIDALLKASSDADAVVRAAAFKAIGRQGGDKAFDRLLEGIGRASGPDRDAAEEAMIELAGNDSTTRIHTAYEKASEVQKGALLRIMSRRHAPDIDTLLLKETANNSAEIRAGAAGGLAFLAETRYESALMQLAERGPAEVTQAAIGGLLEISRKLEKTNPSKSAGLYAKSYSMCSVPVQTCAALEGLARTAGPEDIDMVDVLLPLMGETEVAPEVCHAAVRLAMHLPEDRREEAVEIMEAAATLLTKDPARAAIIEHLWKLGVEFDPAREEGFITAWKLAGPFRIAEPKSWNESPFPDAQPDVKAKAAIDGRQYEWKAYRTPDLNGVVQLTRVLGSGDELAAYAYTEITVDATQRVRLLVGSDDGLVIWLNGKRVLAVLDERVLAVNQDHVDADLLVGVNRLLVKSINLTGEWGFCLRVTDPGGQPVPFR